MNAKFRTAMLCLLSLPGASILSAQATPAGHWEGNLQLPNREMAISIDLAKNDKGEWACNFGVPAQGVTGLRCDKLTVAGAKVKFQVPEAPGGPEVEADLQDSGGLVGNLLVQGNAFQFNLKKTGEAKIAAVVASPAVDKRFEGDWSGSLDTPNGSLRLVIHIQNQPDNTVKVTLDSPDQGTSGMPMSDIAQKESAIEMKLKMVNGGFKGTLNKEGTEIAGEWSQGPGSLPLVLKKAAGK